MIGKNKVIDAKGLQAGQATVETELIKVYGQKKALLEMMRITNLQSEYLLDKEAVLKQAADKLAELETTYAEIL